MELRAPLEGRGPAAWRTWPLVSLLTSGLVATAAWGLAPEALAHDGQGDAAVALAPAVPPKPKTYRHPREKSYMKRTWGVEPIFVRQTAAGHMLEFRYKVLDAEKAKPLFERRTKPVLTHMETGAKLIVPTPAKTGALRNSDAPIAGRTYWMFFSNPGKLVKSGEQVSIQIGKFHADRLVVQ
jgi:hypothetical protein